MNTKQTKNDDIFIIGAWLRNMMASVYVAGAPVRFCHHLIHLHSIRLIRAFNNV